jgi:hypothetical protein
MNVTDMNLAILTATLPKPEGFKVKASEVDVPKIIHFDQKPSITKEAELRKSDEI